MLRLSNDLRKQDDAGEQIAPSDLSQIQGPVARLMRFFGVLRAWTNGHWLRSVIVAGTILSLIAITMAGWAYLASVALDSGQLSCDDILKALDESRYEDARADVSQMLKSGALPRSEYGGPLFVLGAVKINDAETQATPDRRRLEYLVASRYLSEARAYGFPPQRLTQGLYLLGQSLVECGQFNEGLEVLDELLADEATKDDALALEAHRLIATTCLLMPSPNLNRALAHNSALLASLAVQGDTKANALIFQAECLTRSCRFDEAQDAVAAISTQNENRDAVELLRGKILIAELETATKKAEAGIGTASSNDSLAKVAEAITHLQAAASQGEQTIQTSRQVEYHIARCLELKGDTEAALKQYARTRQLYGDSFEGLAAALAEADLLRKKDDFEGALAGYQRVLGAFKNVVIYRSYVLTQAQIRERIMTALKDFADRHRFEACISLVVNLQPLFSRVEQTELRGGMLQQWGNFLVSESTDSDPEAEKVRKAGRQRLRAAGLAHEQLAELRYATKSYTTDLWKSAESYFAGHSFTSTIRLIDKYLENEPELRNAAALLRLGQAHLALRQIPQSIAAFEECIEFHALDDATYQARIDCAKANWHQGQTSRAEQLLRDNIAGSSLKPSSREWKDSLFELGLLLHETGQYEQAIGTLEEAVQRYPDDPQRLVAQYVIGESYRRWAQEMLKRSQQARTVSERNKNEQVASDRLNAALKQFEEVQVSITLKTHDLHSDPLLGSMLRNCYMLEGTVLFDLKRYKEAIEAYSNVASLYPDNPFVLETFVQIANCWRRLGQEVKARGAIQQAQIALEGLPPNSDFASTTALNREEWKTLLTDMSKW